MAIPDLTRPNLDFFAERIHRLTPDSQRLWGEMDVVRMMRRLRQTLDISMGEI